MVIIISELAYSLHLGSDKNKKNNVRNSAKNNISGTSSMSNNAIQNAKQLSKVDHHNYRMYDNKQDEIIIVKSTSSLYKDIENFYKNEFEEARIEYNNKQTRNDRKIDDLACEMIIELGDKKFWDTKSLNYKHKMTSVYSKQVNDLEKLVQNFKICSAIIHYDETIPHMHIVGVSIKYNCKTGMSMQVDKTTDKYRDVKELSANLNIITKQARQDSRKIKNLQENNEALDLRVDNLTSKVNEQQEKIDELRQDNFNLKYRLEQFEEFFKKLLNLFKRMIKRTKKSESYLEVLNDMHDNRIINNETLDNILNDKNYIKEKDDFEL